MSGDTKTKEEVHARLIALGGVRDVDLSGFPERIAVRSDPAGAGEITSAALGSLLKAELGLDTSVRVDLGSAQSTKPETRVRFESLEVGRDEPGRVRVQVTLEWNGVRHEGEAGGESGSAGELRASGMATVRALGKVVDDDEAFTIVGVKEMHVFDHDIIAVLLISSRLPDRRMIGLTIVDGDRHRAAALAVLNATNRALGSLSGTGGS